MSLPPGGASGIVTNPTLTGAIALPPFDGDAVVAFKAGYAMSDTRYYSWLGGVPPDWC